MVLKWQPTASQEVVNPQASSEHLLEVALELALSHCETQTHTKINFQQMH